MRRRVQRGQSTTEYMLAISVVVVALWTSWYTLVGNKDNGPLAESFKNAKQTIEAPYP